MNSITISKLLNKHSHEMETFGVSKISLFGSYLKGNYSDKSDVDFLVEFKEQKKNFKNYMHLHFFLENLFGKKIELITPESLSKYFGKAILNEAKDVFRA